VLSTEVNRRSERKMAVHCRNGTLVLATGTWIYDEHEFDLRVIPSYDPRMIAVAKLLDPIMPTSHDYGDHIAALFEPRGVHFMHGSAEDVTAYITYLEQGLVPSPILLTDKLDITHSQQSQPVFLTTPIGKCSAETIVMLDKIDRDAASVFIIDDGTSASSAREDEDDEARSHMYVTPELLSRLPPIDAKHLPRVTESPPTDTEHLSITRTQLFSYLVNVAQFYVSREFAHMYGAF
jgi:hypothetical protein